jgi:hypothetical protein
VTPASPFHELATDPPPPFLLFFSHLLALYTEGGTVLTFTPTTPAIQTPTNIPSGSMVDASQFQSSLSAAAASVNGSAIGPVSSASVGVGKSVASAAFGLVAVVLGVLVLF